MRHLLLLPLVLFSTTAQAVTLNVPGDHSSVTAAVAAAGVNDVIQIGVGVYSPTTTGETFPLVLNVDGVELVGAGMGLTVLDAEDTGTVVEFDAPTGRIANMTLTRGNGDWGGGVRVFSGAPEIAGLLVESCGAFRRGSGINVEAAASPWIHHNVVWECYDTDLVHSGDPHGIQMAGTSTGTVENNLIARTDSNGLFVQESSAPLIRNNMFLDNGTPGVRGRGICALGGSTVTIAYNIFDGNEIAAVIMPDPLNPGLIDVSATVANDLDLADGVHDNLDGDPELIDPDNGDFTVVGTSIAVDAGDPASPLDPDGTRADIGPFYYDQLTATPNALARLAVLRPNHPNPFNPATNLRVQLAKDLHVQLDIIDARGRLVRTLVNGLMEAGDQSVRWDGRNDAGRDVVSGVYLARLRAGDLLESRPMVLVR